jgi:hypothetical protein
MGCSGPGRATTHQCGRVMIDVISAYPIRFATAITIPVTNVARQENSRRSLKIIDMRRAPRSLPVQAQVASLRACCRSGSRLLITCKLERFTRAPLSDHTTARSRRTSGRQGGAPATQTSITGLSVFGFCGLTLHHHRRKLLAFALRIRRTNKGPLLRGLLWPLTRTVRRPLGAPELTPGLLL